METIQRQSPPLYWYSPCWLNVWISSAHILWTCILRYFFILTFISFSLDNFSHVALPRPPYQPTSYPSYGKLKNNFSIEG